MNDIVIVNWNSGPYLAGCLESLRRFGGEVMGKVIVVDNGSDDGSEAMDGRGLALEPIRESKNLGFAKACNIGAVRGTAPYLLFLNPDAALMEGALDTTYRFMESEAASHVGICGVRLLDADGMTQRHCARFPSWRTYLGRALGLEGRVGALFPSHFMREFDHLTSRAVDQVIGAFFLVRRDLFVTLGGFDERFFVYLEEVDFSLRATQIGYSTWYLAEATAFHKGGGTSQQVKAHRLLYSIESRMLYALKQFSQPQAAVVIILALFVEPISRLVRAALRGSGRAAWDVIKGYAMIWARLPGLILERRAARVAHD